jgi:rubrerythrin
VYNLAIFVCKECGTEKEGRCRPQKCAKCGAGKDAIEKKE